MTTAAQLTRINLDTMPGLPKLPHIPENWDIALTPQQQEENLLHVALWIVERDIENFDMDQWHETWSDDDNVLPIYGKEGLNGCGTVHYIAGFAQVMAGEFGFTLLPHVVGGMLLGDEAQEHFYNTDRGGLAFLKKVIARNS